MSREAFVYCWTNINSGQLYVGVHKGRQDDGYVCSSVTFNEEYRRSPSEFTRQIIAEGTYGDCLDLEEAILVAADAAKSPDFYNKHNGKNRFYCVSHTEETKNKISLKTRDKNNPNYGKRHSAEVRAKMGRPGRKASVETKRKLSESRSGDKHWNFGKHHSAEVRAKMSKAKMGSRASEEARLNMSIAGKLRWAKVKNIKF